MNTGLFPGSNPSLQPVRSKGSHRVFVLLVALIALLGTACGGSVTTDPTTPNSQGSGGTGTPPPPPVQTGNGTASLSWQAPTKTVDGQPLSDLVGYRIYYGTSTGQYTDEIDAITGTSYLVTQLAEGKTYYFSVTAYDSNGMESDHSSEVSKYVN